MVCILLVKIFWKLIILFDLYILFQGNFLKDKLKCPNCSTNLGAFDYVSGHKCPCKQQCVPFIHLVKSKIDIQYANRSPENTSEHAEQS